MLHPARSISNRTRFRKRMRIELVLGGDRRQQVEKERNCLYRNGLGYYCGSKIGDPCHRPPREGGPGVEPLDRCRLTAHLQGHLKLLCDMKRNPSNRLFLLTATLLFVGGVTGAAAQQLP